MITIDTSTFIVLILAAALGGALVGVLPAWRRVVGGGQGLPVWGFLRRRGTRLERAAALAVEIRCEMCDSKARCGLLLAAGERTPGAPCPNLELFQER
jgi:hypothetical protein